MHVCQNANISHDVILLSPGAWQVHSPGAIGKSLYPAVCDCFGPASVLAERRHWVLALQWDHDNFAVSLSVWSLRATSAILAQKTYPLALRMTSFKVMTIVVNM